MRKRTGLILAATLVAGCVTTEQLAPRVDTLLVVQSGESEFDLVQLRHGRTLYLTRCALCHSPEAVVDYSGAEWRELLPGMVEKTELSPDEATAVEAYILAVLQQRDAGASRRAGEK